MGCWTSELRFGLSTPPQTLFSVHACSLLPLAPSTAVAMHQTGDRISCHIGLDAPNRVDAMSEERLQMCQDVQVTKPFQVQGT